MNFSRGGAEARLSRGDFRRDFKPTPVLASLLRLIISDPNELKWASLRLGGPITPSGLSRLPPATFGAALDSKRPSYPDMIVWRLRAQIYFGF